MAAGAATKSNQSSTAAWMNYDYYSFTKLATNGITCVLARELGPKGIRVNAIAPGPTDTKALRDKVPEEVPQGHGRPDAAGAPRHARRSAQGAGVPAIRRCGLGDGFSS